MSYPNHLTKFSSESNKHFVAKSVLFWILRDMKHEVASEWRVPNGYVDLCDRTTRTFYEIEFHVSPKFRARKLELYRISGYDIIIVDCSKLPSDISEVRDYLERFVVPD